eukprot:CAMPEP_0198339126 /NCGR_PEP_ID=MMETSP1450-20131203/37864_1 /TAXON_ID=753684 ORGANISM="Madagascaria erythrocladiodes, Strain CCMP3234" /NCGR_SAMPLE_ID=MMETSP1450 /ASSEMBLY_ACC=CAM_ASM_001115 /LENGTH=64 /DNA_ID=CAMNT_0044044031 /DNA_START=9 /DNA_END=203 /DNA_ORIENTATION=-
MMVSTTSAGVDGCSMRTRRAVRSEENAERRTSLLRLIRGETSSSMASLTPIPTTHAQRGSGVRV